MRKLKIFAATLLSLTLLSTYSTSASEYRFESELLYIRATFNRISDYSSPAEFAMRFSLVKESLDEFANSYEAKMVAEKGPKFMGRFCVMANRFLEAKSSLIEYAEIDDLRADVSQSIEDFESIVSAYGWEIVSFDAESKNPVSVIKCNLPSQIKAITRNLPGLIVAFLNSAELSNESRTRLNEIQQLAHEINMARGGDLSSRVRANSLKMIDIWDQGCDNTVDLIYKFHRSSLIFSKITVIDQLITAIKDIKKYGVNFSHPNMCKN